jgi:hypothetical protein
MSACQLLRIAGPPSQIEQTNKQFLVSPRLSWVAPVRVQKQDAAQDDPKVATLRSGLGIRWPPVVMSLA